MRNESVRTGRDENGGRTGERRVVIGMKDHGDEDEGSASQHSTEGGTIPLLLPSSKRCVS
jgi:hypothetical protein